MKKLAVSLTLAMFIIIAMSGLIFAGEQKADLNFGDDWDNGSYWGLNYLGETGEMNSYLHIGEGGGNKTITGPYIDGGQSVSTIIGNKLGVNYSPYVANFADNLIGLRVKGYKLDADLVSLTFDGTYELGWGNEKVFDGQPAIIPSDGNFAVNINGSLSQLNVNNTYLRYVENNTSYINYALSGDMEVIDGVTVDGVYSNYGKSDAYLYEVTGKYVVTDNLAFNAGQRNSSNSINNIERGANNRHIDNNDEIQRIYKWDNGSNVGMELKFNTGNIAQIPALNNTLNVNYNTTNPDARGDLDDSLDTGLKTTVNGFTINQKHFMVIPEAQADNKTYYDLSVVTPAYDVSLAESSNISVTGKFNYDYDKNYTAGVTNKYATAGVNVSSTQNIWRLKNVTLQGLVFADMPNFLQANASTDVKYALMGKYDAPNGIKFRVQYYGFDYQGNEEDVKGNDRYAPYTWYGNDTYGGGVRVAVGIPF